MHVSTNDTILNITYIIITNALWMSARVCSYGSLCCNPSDLSLQTTTCKPWCTVPDTSQGFVTICDEQSEGDFLLVTVTIQQVGNVVICITYISSIDSQATQDRIDSHLFSYIFDPDLFQFFVICKYAANPVLVAHACIWQCCIHLSSTGSPAVFAFCCLFPGCQWACIR